MVPEPKPARTSRRRANDKVASILRDRIRSGAYQAGEWLPTERMLTQDLQSHRTVVREALAQLEKEGFIERRPHCRPIVRAPEGQALPPAAPEAAAPFQPSRFVALVMWHGGGPMERGGSAQQRIFWGMNQALGLAGYHTVFLDLGDAVRSERENADREAAHLRYVLDQGFGGAVFYSYAYQSNRSLIREVAHRVPFVLIDRTLPGVEADFAGTANYQAMYDAAMRLIRQGHRRIAYLTTAESINSVQDRLQGYLRATQDTFHEDAYEMILTTPSLGSRSWLIFDVVFRQPPDRRPTALLCVNDYAAIQAENHLTRLGLRVPEDVSLAGFDDIVQTLPSGVGLATVAQPFEEIGKTAAELFLRRAHDPSAPPAHIELPAEFVPRDSVQPL